MPSWARPVGDVVRDLVGEDRAERGDADRAAEACGRTRPTELAAPSSLRADGVLHGEDEVLHGHAEADADQQPCRSLSSR